MQSHSGLRDAEIGPLLLTTPSLVVVEVTTEWCIPCRLLRPVMRKLAMEFASRMIVVELDGDTATSFKQANGVDTFPQLLFFRNGELVGREVGFGGPDEIRAAVNKRLDVMAAGTRSAAELSFCNAHACATARLEEIIKPASDDLEPEINAIAPVMEAFEAALTEDLAAGRMSQQQVEIRRKAELGRLYAGFEDKIVALRVAQNEALAAYERSMREAVEHFAAASEALKDLSSAVPLNCRPDQPFCRGATPGGSKQSLSVAEVRKF
jgi:thioredoxin 1